MRREGRLIPGALGDDQTDGAGVLDAFDDARYEGILFTGDNDTIAVAASVWRLSPTRNGCRPSGRG